MLVKLTACHLLFLSPQIVKTINAKISNNDGRLGPVYLGGRLGKVPRAYKEEGAYEVIDPKKHISA
jgi:hypothetical protein